MSDRAFATDYDETLALGGQVTAGCVNALKRLKNARWKLILVTGRRLDELLAIFPEIALFDRVVAENGGTLYDPATRAEKTLASSPPVELIAALKKNGVPVSIGRVLLASEEPYDKAILQAIQDTKLEYHLIFNKGSIMVLPSGVNKATGLKVALGQLGVPAAETVGVGDGENDHAFLELCGVSVALQNAVDSLKQKANMITNNPNGRGVQELIEQLLSGKM